MTGWRRYNQQTTPSQSQIVKLLTVPYPQALSKWMVCVSAAARAAAPRAKRAWTKNIVKIGGSTGCKTLCWRLKAGEEPLPCRAPFYTLPRRSADLMPYPNHPYRAHPAARAYLGTYDRTPSFAQTQRARKSRRYGRGSRCADPRARCGEVPTRVNGLQ